MIYKKGISACLIVKNEEVNLRSCINSFIDYVDEIIVVDTGSSDSTVDISKELGCNVIQSEWINDFSYSRNIAISNANYEFILSIDADEKIENPHKLKETISKANDNSGGWLIDVISYTTRKDGGQDKFIAKLLRLFRNHQKIRFSGSIHEQVIQPILEQKLNLENSDIIIQHSGYSTSADERFNKQKRNLEILDISIQKNPSDSYLLYHRAKTYLAISDLNSAEQDIEKAIETIDPDSIMATQIFNYGAVIAYRAMNYNKALNRAFKSYKIVPNQAFANFILGEVFYETGHINKAVQHYKLMEIAIQNPSVIAKISGDYYIKPTDLLFKTGKCLLLLKQFEEAKIYFKQGLIFEPNNPYCLLGLANVEFNNSNISEAKILIDKLSQLFHNENRIKLIYNNFYLKYKSIINSKNTSSRILSKPLISLAMIVKNEEKFLEGCLDSVKDLVDEIIIVDTGSTDNTLSIAKKFNAKIYHFNWINDFSAARNESIKNATGEWILYLDADERLIAGKENLRFLLTSLPENVGGLVCSIDSLHSKSDGSSEMHRGSYPRLFRNYGYPKICFLGKVHEQITQSIRALGKEILLSELVIEHLGYNQSLEIVNQKARRNYEMLMQQIKSEPTDGYLWFQLGQTLGHLKLQRQAEEAIKFAIQCGNLSDSIYSSAAATLSQLSGNDKRFSEALKWSEEALKISNEFLYALNLKAYSLLYLNRYEESEIAFNQALEIFDNQNGVPKSGFDIKVPLEIISKGLEMAKNKDNKISVTILPV